MGTPNHTNHDARVRNDRAHPPNRTSLRFDVLNTGSLHECFTLEHRRFENNLETKLSLRAIEVGVSAKAWAKRLFGDDRINSPLHGHCFVREVSASEVRRLPTLGRSAILLVSDHDSL